MKTDVACQRNHNSETITRQLIGGDARPGKSSVKLVGIRGVDVSGPFGNGLNNRVRKSGSGMNAFGDDFGEEGSRLDSGVAKAIAILRDDICGRLASEFSTVWSGILNKEASH